MHCTKCGAELEDSASFCTTCGAPVSNARSGHTQAIPIEQTATAASTSPFDDESKAAQQLAQDNAQQPSQEKPKNNRLVAPIVIAAIVIIALIIAVVVILINQGEEETKTTPSNVSATTAQEATPTFENAFVRITFPESIASKVKISESEDGSYVFISDAQTGTYLADIILAEEQREDETLHAVYSLGDIDVSGISDTVVMTLSYLNADNNTIYWGSAKSTPRPIELGITRIFGLTAEEFANYIELKTPNGFKPCEVEYLGGDQIPAEESTASGVPTSAFWGIWAQASKDKAEMEAAAQRMRSDYGFDAFVVLTTDWSNLNSEPWYCVSLGNYSSQDAANAALSKARAAYADAYVKYSGSKK